MGFLDIVALVVLGFVVLAVVAVGAWLGCLAAAGATVFGWVTIFNGDPTGIHWIFAIGGPIVFLLLTPLVAPSRSDRDRD